MKDTDSDRGVREQFARLREEDRALAISFERARAGSASALRVRRRGHPYRLVAGTAAIAAIAAIAVIAFVAIDGFRGEPRPDLGGTVALRNGLPLGEWKAPTDFLLRTPGMELLRTIPALGRLTGWDLTDEKMYQRTPTTTRLEERTS